MQTGFSCCRTILLFTLIFGVLRGYTATAQTSPSSRGAGKKGLKAYYQDYFPIGVAVSPRALRNDEAPLIAAQFNSITPENAMKMGVIHPGENEYDFSGADSIVAFASRNNMKVRGHTLCWHKQVPGWFFKRADGDTASKEILLQRLKQHITTIVGRYRGKVYAWDVVNEVISDNHDEFYRNSAWFKICGPEFIEKAFVWAHEADPGAILFYNDYNEINPAKRARILQMVRSLRDKGIPVHGIGLQAHWAVDQPSANQLEQTLKDFSSLGLPLQITELDMSIYPKEHEGRGRLSKDSSAVYSDSIAGLQAEQYKMWFEKFRKYRKNITGITFWNISDRYSWLDNFPVRGRKDYPLLFDASLQPKKAFHEVTDF